MRVNNGRIEQRKEEVSNKNREKKVIINCVMLQIPQQNMFSVQFPHSQAIVYYFLHTVFFFFFLSFSFFSNAQGGNEKKAASIEKSSPKLIFFFKRGQWTTQIFFFFQKTYIAATKRTVEREGSNSEKRNREREVNAVKEFIYILILYELVIERTDGGGRKKKVYFLWTEIPDTPCYTCCNL